MQHEHVRIAVSDASRPGAETVAARRVGEHEWKLARSPLYATGVAAGDVIRILDSETGAFEVVSRDGNVCVQFYLDDAAADDAQATSQAADTIARDLRCLGGSLDAHTPGLIAFTIPVDVGFPAIEGVFAAAVERYPGSQWQYSNVYDPVSGAPLGWWSS
jgi:hypothetical protein